MKKFFVFILPFLIAFISEIFEFLLMYSNISFNPDMAEFKINKKNFFICSIIFFYFLHQSEQCFYYIFMVFPVCQNKIKECMEFLCLSKHHDNQFIKECVLFYNKSVIEFGLK